MSTITYKLLGTFLMNSSSLYHESIMMDINYNEAQRIKNPTHEAKGWQG